MRSLCELSDDRITRETLSYNNPCPSSPSSTIYIYIYTGPDLGLGKLGSWPGFYTTMGLHISCHILFFGILG